LELGRDVGENLILAYRPRSRPRAGQAGAGREESLERKKEVSKIEKEKEGEEPCDRNL
jgi:hypothetical protein